MWLIRVANATKRSSFESLKKLRIGITRAMAFSTEERGNPNDFNYKIYFKSGDKYISPFHDVPLFASDDKKTFNMIVEVPRWTNAKMEINTSEKLNPIKQDIKKNKLRFVNNCFPYHGYIWNYGALPQTWEDPGHVDPNTGAKGDNDPLDVCEIGYRVAERGEIIQVKILGTLALIDEGETDWKILAIDVKDPLAEKLNDIADIREHMPGFIEATVNWFKIYKIPTGKPPNVFAFEGKPKDRSFATGIVEETHEQWKKLVNGSGAGSISCANTTVTGSPGLISASDAKAVVDTAAPPGPPKPIDQDSRVATDKWYFVKAD